MPNLSMYSRMLGSYGFTSGEARKSDSDMIMEATWDGDIQSRVAYIYDYYHDSEPLKLRNLSSCNDRLKTAIDIKYVKHTTQTYDKDAITYHIQFKPRQKCNLQYFKELYEDTYSSIFPCGLYIDIPDDSKQYNRWLIVNTANYYDSQFPTFEVLPCDHLFQWIFHGKKYQMAGVLRSMNSYNSGIWTDYKITTPEDVQKFIVPLNKESETLFYNQRMIIDSPVTEREAIAWQVSKLKTLSPNGLNRITLAQDKFDQNKDYIEKDENGKIIGMWCNYYNDVPLEESNTRSEDNYTSEIIYSGLKPELKSGGSYKTFTANYYDAAGNLIDQPTYKWDFLINGETFGYESLIKIIYPNLTNNLKANQVKVKFTGGDDYIGSTLTIKNDSTHLNVAIIGM